MRLLVEILETASTKQGKWRNGNASKWIFTYKYSVDSTVRVHFSCYIRNRTANS